MKSIHAASAVGLLLTPFLLHSQVGRERSLTPLKPWASPLYWQPSQQEAEELARRPELATGGGSGVRGPLVFVAMTPCRIADTRSGQGFSGAFGPPSLAAAASRTFPMQSSSTCSLPSAAAAYSLNITVVPQGTLYFLTAYPSGQTMPLASTLNSFQGYITSNAAVVAAGISGSVDVFASNPTDVIIDVNGYYTTLTGGSATTNTAYGYHAFPNYGSGTGNTAVGSSALEYNSSGGSNTGIGFAALNTNTTGSSNTGVGSSALMSNTSGGENTATGNIALISNTTGNANTADGAWVLQANTTGNENTATGYEALQLNVNGNSNTAAGVLAMQQNTNGTNNTATGWHALMSNTNGLQNLASGSTALLFNTSGFNNTAVGAGALSFNSTGSNNIAVGYSAASLLSSNSSNNIHIGNRGALGDSATIRIGTLNTQTSFFAAGIRGVITGNNDAVPVVIDSNGQLGTINSSRRFKQDIHNMGEASRGLLRLRPVTFRYIKPFADGSKPLQYGLIAEEVAAVYPDLVARSADGKIETVKYQVLDSMLLNEIQRQHAEITHLEQQLQEEQERMARLEAALAKTPSAP